ncbi:type VII secretion protein EccB [Mycobacterium sp.]|uniref:type VII secretion protein EccB n=1 Tax=Mycobacterium sp. TaxID=1785 RepID=UPI002DA4C3E5|nr:type VII secretion protein EccB [Mycobacterium sp.]
MTTRLQISGYRFLLRRMEHALVRGDVRMLDDPLRAQSLSLIAGCVLAVIAVAGCAILAFVRPQGALGDAPIVMTRQSGALYVRIGDTMHPVLNLASARLITGSPANPEMVGEAAVINAKRGPLVGIPGAPATVDPPLGGDESGWTVCDDGASTTVIAGAVQGRSGPGLSVLVTPQSESAATTYLLYGGWRARVDLRDHTVVRALGLDGVTPRPVSRALLDAIPEAPQISAPAIPRAGSAGPPSLHRFTVGAVVRVIRAQAKEYYVVLADGVQRIGEVTADLIRFRDSQRGREIITVEPDVIGAVPMVDELPVTTFPERADVADDVVVCGQWWPAGAGANTALLLADSLPLDGGALVGLVQDDGKGPNVDGVVIPPGRSAYVRASGITGDGGSAGALYLVNDSGIVFGIHDDDAAKRLGLSGAPGPAPWPVLARLPRGPELGVQAASVVRDSVGSTS